MSNYPAAYQVSKGSILNVDKAFYRSLIADPAQRRLVESHVVPIRSGFAWKVPAGHVFRIVTLEGPQVADFNMWNLHNPRERMWASRTRQLQQAHVSTHDRLWSTLPYLRPMATITEDTLASYGVDSDGGRVHDLLGTRCDPYVNKLLTGEDFHFHCHSNLTRAVRARPDRAGRARRAQRVPGHRPERRRQVLHEGLPGPARRLPGDVRRDRPAVRAVHLPRRRPVGADVGPEARDPIDVCRPLGVEVYALDPALLQGWTSPGVSPYKGVHGLHPEKVEWK